MTGYKLPKNYIENPEALLRKNWSHAVSTSATPPTNELVTPAPSATTTMAQKSLHEYSVPAIDNMPIGLAVNMGNGFELRTGLITMVQANPFCGLPSKNANAHLQHFLELCDTIIIKGVALESIRLHLFLFFLLGRVKQWFYKDREAINTWANCSMVFLAKFFPMSKTNALRGRISNF